MSTPQPEPFAIKLFARWPDMDFNQHMRNAAYLGAAEDCRMQFLATQGFDMDTLRTAGIGPVVVEDRLTYKKELRLLEPFAVQLAVSALTRDARKMKLRNTFVRDSDAAVCAVIDSVVLWFDLKARKPMAPPEALREVWLKVPHTAEFAWFDA